MKKYLWVVVILIVGISSIFTSEAEAWKTKITLFLENRGKKVHRNGGATN